MQAQSASASSEELNIRAYTERLRSHLTDNPAGDAVRCSVADLGAAGDAGSAVLSAAGKPHLKVPAETRLQVQLLSDFKVSRAGRTRDGSRSRKHNPGLPARVATSCPQRVNA